MSVVTLGSTRRITLPPGPPLPPSGPPSGLNFSRCTEATPLPPRPAVTCSVTRSTNVGTAMGAPSCASLWTISGKYGEGAPCVLSRAPLRGRVTSSRPRSLGGRDHVDDAAAALGAELDVAADQGEQRVVAAAADAAARVEVGAALAHDDLAGVDQLAAVALHTEPLGVRVPTVLGRGRALLVCHEFSPSCLWVPVRRLRRRCR